LLRVPVVIFFALLVPLVIFFALVLAVFGAFVALAVTGRALDLSAQIGLLMLLTSWSPTPSCCST
jgi:multidrug efflux pump subunit AcrB